MENQMIRPKGIVLMSGGMDSCVLAAIAAQECRPAALHVSYGQLTQARERRAFEEITDYYKISQRLIVDQSYLKRIGGSALTDPQIPLREADPSAPLPSTALGTGRAGLEATDPVPNPVARGAMRNGADIPASYV